MNKQTPSQGLKILEELHKKYPNNQRACNSLINVYIKLGYHDIALKMVANILDNKIDVQSITFRIWEAHKNKELNLEKSLWKQKLSKIYQPEIHATIYTMLLMSKHDINITTDDIPLVCVERNEMLRLPFFLEYYRNLGITQFIFVDNNSDDDSLEFLLRQDDCHVFWTNDNYDQSGCVISWVHSIVRKYVKSNQWCIHADADEFLVYPFCETLGLKIFLQYLDKYDYDLVKSYMLDMFPKNLKDQVSISIGDNLINKSPYFYNNYKFVNQIQCPYVRPNGGIFSIFDIPGIWMSKISLFKNHKDFYFFSATHASTPVNNIADVSSCYLHFKMIGDFMKKATIEQKRKNHWAGGRYYRKYCKIYESYIDENTDLSRLKHSEKFINSDQLLELELLECSNKWKNWFLYISSKYNVGNNIKSGLWEYFKHNWIRIKLVSIRLSRSII